MHTVIIFNKFPESIFMSFKFFKLFKHKGAFSVIVESFNLHEHEKIILTDFGNKFFNLDIVMNFVAVMSDQQTGLFN